MTTENNDLNRRDFLKIGGSAAVAGALATGLDLSAAGREAREATGYDKWPFTTPPMETVRIGYVGIGGQGSGHVRNLLGIPGCVITAVCDIKSDRTDWAVKQITAKGHPAPKVYTNGPRDFERLCQQNDVDLVYNATPWEWHVPIMLAAMKNGKHTATEVPAAMTVDDCWAMVEAAEKYQKHCLLMENCNYDRNEMMVLNMVRQGLFGEIVHAEGAYLHDLRAIKFADEGEGLWRRAWATKLNGNLYPTHGLGPIANCIDNNRGDRFDYMVSMSGPSRGLQDWRKEHVAADSPKQNERYVLGDMNLSLIKTANGKTVVVQHCTNLPQPYNRIHLVQGTKGLFQGYPNRVYIEGKSARAHQWDQAAEWMKTYEHPLWTEIGPQATSAGHGGMDYLEDYRLVKCLREGKPTDMNVYDAASISAVVGLSVQSVAKRGQPMTFPDFTRGKWKITPPLTIA
jgi:hypothetical protein